MYYLMSKKYTAFLGGGLDIVSYDKSKKKLADEANKVCKDYKGWFIVDENFVIVHQP